MLVKCPTVQWQPDGLTIHAEKWFLGAGFLGAPPISPTLPTPCRFPVWANQGGRGLNRETPRREKSRGPPKGDPKRGIQKGGSKNKATFKLPKSDSKVTLRRVAPLPLFGSPFGGRRKRTERRKAGPGPGYNIICYNIIQ